MRRSFVVLLMVLPTIILFPLIAGGQSRGHGSVFVGRPAPVVPVGPVVTPGQSFGPGIPFAVARPAPHIEHNPGFFRPYGHRPVVVAQPFGFYSPYFPFYTTPIYGYPSYLPPIYPEPSYAAPPQPPVSQNELDLAYQVGQLTQEVERLRQEQAARQEQELRQEQGPRKPPPPATPTVLVFRDGHRVEIVSYAITGQALYVMDGHVSMKIPLTDLDLDATRKENQERGLRFLPFRQHE